MSTATGPRLLGLRTERSTPRRRASANPSDRRPLGLIIRGAGAAAIIALTAFAITAVSARGDFGLALRWSIGVMALDLGLSWIFIDRHLNPRRRR